MPVPPLQRPTIDFAERDQSENGGKNAAVVGTQVYSGMAGPLDASADGQCLC